MTANGVGFYPFAAAALIGALGVVGLPSLRRAAYALALLGLAVGVLFLDLGDELLFAMEVLVYAVAVPALLLVAVDLTRSREDRLGRAFTGWWPVALAAACGLGALLLGVVAVSRGSWTVGGPGPQGGLTQAMGELIFKRYALPFGVGAVLLLTALVGAVVTGRRDDLEEELEAGEAERRRREERIRRRREDRERARRGQRTVAATAAGDDEEAG